MSHLLCGLCGGKKAVQNFEDPSDYVPVRSCHFNDGDVLTSHSDPQPADRATSKSGVSEKVAGDTPTKSEYVFEGAKNFIEILGAVSQFAPEPVPAIVNLGVALMNAFDASHNVQHESLLTGISRLRKLR